MEFLLKSITYADLLLNARANLDLVLQVHARQEPV